jgi:hypothetical protein
MIFASSSSVMQDADIKEVYDIRLLSFNALTSAFLHSEGLGQFLPLSTLRQTVLTMPCIKRGIERVGISTLSPLLSPSLSC